MANAVTGVAVRGSCGQPEIWSAGSKHHVTALETAPSVQALMRGPARQGTTTSADGHGPSSPPSPPGESGGVIVFVDQAAQYGSPVDPCGAGVGHGGAGDVAVAAGDMLCDALVR